MKTFYSSLSIPLLLLALTGMPWGLSPLGYAQEADTPEPAAVADESIPGTTPAEPAPANVPEAEPAPAEPAPVEPAPVEPAPAEPAPAETAPAEPAPVEPAPVEPAPVEPAPAEPAPAESGTAEPAHAESAPTESGTETPAAEAPATGRTATPAPAQSPPPTKEVSSGIPWLMLGIVVALFVVPILIGNRLARRLRMPDHGWKISLAIGTIAAAVVILFYGELKFGVDLAGGVTLIYELEEPRVSEETSAEDRQSSQKVLMEKMIEQIIRRVNPGGQLEVTVREYGIGQIEIIIPEAGQEDLERIKRDITTLGELEFRITADYNQEEDQKTIEKANSLSPYEKRVEIDGKQVAKWVEYNKERFEREGGTPLVTRVGKDRSDEDVQEALVLLDPWNVTGQYLDQTWAGNDPDSGNPAVHFTFKSQGAKLFGKLTGSNLPKPGGGQRRYLGIILNRILESAPGIRDRITSRGIINGDFTVAQTETLAGILNAGSLPAALNIDPISEESISPTIGLNTVQKGKVAMLISLIAVLLFMLVYYRFSGFVACLALAVNLVLILGIMILIRAHLTLPGLAGLVLTVGMSVDANVLIFERIREELMRGAAMRMAIRNGFNRATRTIVDANLTTLITGIVLFWIGTDQIKGFAVTLILGILMSMYTAIFCSRIIFDIGERQRWITALKMMQLVGQTQINFLGKTAIAALFSCILIAVGLVAVFLRGPGLLNIDFTGGVSVTMVLDEPTPQGEIFKRLAETELGERNLLVVEQGTDGTQYTINVRYEAGEQTAGTTNSESAAVEKVEKIIKDEFGEALTTYRVQIEDLEQIPEETPPTDGSETPAEEKSESGNLASDRQNVFAGGTQTQLIFGDPQDTLDEGVAFQSVSQWIEEFLAQATDNQVAFKLSFPGYIRGSAERSEKWNLVVALPPDQVKSVLDQFQQQMNSTPRFPLSNRIGGRVAGQMQQLATLAILLSLVCIIGYIWLRFQRVVFGLAAVVALVHDVLVTLGMLAISAYFVQYAGPLADALQVEPFQISLPILAAFLTIIGYSLNDTIVVFDRIREVRGKSPNLTSDMINTSINQTLSRTLLTSLTTFIVVAILYFAGGAGIHGFAFALVVGVLVGTYSSIFIASPVLLWMSTPRGKAAAPTA